MTTGATDNEISWEIFEGSISSHNLKNSKRIFMFGCNGVIGSIHSLMCSPTVTVVANICTRNLLPVNKEVKFSFSVRLKFF